MFENRNGRFLTSRKKKVVPRLRVVLRSRNPALALNCTINKTDTGSRSSTVSSEAKKRLADAPIVAVLSSCRIFEELAAVQKGFRSSDRSSIPTFDGPRSLSRADMFMF